MQYITNIVDLTSWQVILFLVGTFLASAVDAALGWRNTLGNRLKERLAALREIHPLAGKILTDAKVSQAESYRRDSLNLSNFSDTVTSGIETLILLFGVTPFSIWAVFHVFPGIWPCVGIALGLFAVSLLGRAYEIPFSYLDTFSVEERHGFNRMSRGMFFSDQLKGIAISAVFGIPISTVCAFFLERYGDASWTNFALIFLALVATGPVMEYLSTHVLMRLFNRFEPLKKGSLRRKIEGMLVRNGMTASSIVVMDSGKRSSHVNAFVHGFGRKKRIVLFDELLKKLSEEEVLSVVAHEIGHAKLHHLAWERLISTVSSAAIVGLALWGMNSFSLYDAFGYRYVNVGNLPSFRFVGFMLVTSLVGAVSWIASPVSAWLSRKMEREADAFAAKENGKDNLRTALLKLNADNLSNVAPDPAYEAWNYSHPSILPRLEALGRIPDAKEKWAKRPGGKGPERKRRRRRTRKNLVFNGTGTAALHAEHCPCRSHVADFSR